MRWKAKIIILIISIVTYATLFVNSRAAKIYKYLKKITQKRQKRNSCRDKCGKRALICPAALALRRAMC